MLVVVGQACSDLNKFLTWQQAQQECQQCRKSNKTCKHMYALLLVMFVMFAQQELFAMCAFLSISQQTCHHSQMHCLTMTGAATTTGIPIMHYTWLKLAWHKRLVSQSATGLVTHQSSQSSSVAHVMCEASPAKLLVLSSHKHNLCAHDCWYCQRLHQCQGPIATISHI